MTLATGVNDSHLKRDLPHHESDGPPGRAILMISSELPEIVGMSDRVYVMREGAIAGELQVGEISQESIMTLATGVNDSHLKAGQA